MKLFLLPQTTKLFIEILREYIKIREGMCLLDSKNHMLAEVGKYFSLT